MLGGIHPAQFTRIALYCAYIRSTQTIHYIYDIPNNIAINFSGESMRQKKTEYCTVNKQQWYRQRQPQQQYHHRRRQRREYIKRKKERKKEKK